MDAEEVNFNFEEPDASDEARNRLKNRSGGGLEEMGLWEDENVRVVLCEGGLGPERRI